MPRYLVGPITHPLTPEHFQAARDRGECLTFGSSSLADQVDIVVSSEMSWDEVVGAVPNGGSIDFLALWLPFADIPSKLWQAPVPIIGLAPRRYMHAHWYRRVLRHCDLAFSDASTATFLTKDGLAHVRPAILCGLNPSFLIESTAETNRDVDLLFVGNLDRATHRERNRWIARLASSGRNVVVKSRVDFAEYRDLLSRAKIVFSYSAQGACTARVFEAIASGALLLEEAGNAEVKSILEPGIEYAVYDDHNLQDTIEHFLSHGDERTAMVNKARRRLAEFSFDALLGKALASVPMEWDLIQERCRQRTSTAFAVDPVATAWSAGRSQGAAQELIELVTAHPENPELANAVGVYAPTAQEAITWFQRALRADPLHPLAGLNLVEGLVAVGQPAEAAVQAREALALLERGDGFRDEHVDSVHYPNSYDLFRVEWERSACQHAGDLAAEREAKRTLVRARLYALSANLTNDLGHYAACAMARADLPISQAALGCALARAQRYSEAIPCLRVAVEGDPFDRLAAQAIFRF